MLIHVTPKIYIPNGFSIHNKIELVDLRIPEFGIHLRGGLELDARKPFPNKHLLVCCLNVGRKAMEGLLFETQNFIDQYSCVVRWAINAERVVSHCVEYRVTDSEYGLVSDKMLLWSKSKNEQFEFKCRYPEEHKNSIPVDAQPRMDVLKTSTGERIHSNNFIQDQFESNLITYRKEVLFCPTLEPERYLHSIWNDGRFPAKESAIKSIY